MVNMIKEMIKELNRAMDNNEISIECVQNLLQQLSKMTGKEYCIIRKRVCYKDTDGFHDAWAYA